MDNNNHEAMKWQKRFERERAARKEAEKLLEEKSAEIYQLNLELEKKIISEIEKNNEKQKIIFQQSKMAAMGEMISNIAHQWRQPLHAILLTNQKIHLNRILGHEIDDELINSVENDIKKQINYLNSTIEDFRNFFKPDKEKVEFQLKESIETSLDIIHATLKQKQIDVIKDFDSNIKIFNLKNELMQVIINILKNAMDVLDERLITDKIIIIRTYEKDNFYFIDVIDNAGGISENILPKIFEPYFTTKHQSKGTGLGLYMSHEIIVKHMNGFFEVKNINFKLENNNYKGACFSISFKK